MSTAIFFDCEFPCAECSQRRFWCGAYDPDPVVAQIGAVKLSLDQNFESLATLRLHVVPRDRERATMALDPFFTRLTGISEKVLATEGRSPQHALSNLERSSEGAQV